jgi:alpha-glucosidase
MRIVGDLTTNHSGSTHEWFEAARTDPAAPEREFYYFREDGSYLGWYNHPTLPKLRFNAELRRRLLEGENSVVGRWLRPPFSLDGWRIDVANMTGRQSWEDSNLDVARAIRQTMLEVKQDAALIAEHFHDASGDLSGDGWHGAMNYAGFLRPVWAWLRSPDYHGLFLGLPVEVPRLGGGAAYRTMRQFHAVAPWRSLATSWSLIGSHDTPRVRTVVGDADTVGVAAGLLFTLPGVPMVFMGDELGGEGVQGEDARRPMPWHRPEKWDQVTLQRYRALAQLRARSPALTSGGLRWIAAHDEFLLYVRESPGEAMLCLAARGAAPPVGVPAERLGLTSPSEVEAVYGDAERLRADAGRVTVAINGPAFLVWRLR